MTSLTTPDETMDLANIGADNLWAVWVKRPQLLQQAGSDAVALYWMLAAPQREGLERIEKEFNSMFVAAMPLAMLQQINTLFPISPSPLPKWVTAALGTASTLILVRSPEGAVRVITHADQMQAGDATILTGDRRDFDKVLEEGNAMLRDCNWTAVFDDVRPSAIRGTVGWLHQQRDPEGAQAMTEILERARTRD